MLSLTRDQLTLLRETMMRGDGCVVGSHRGKFYCRDADRKDAFQALCTLCGIATTARWRGPGQPKKQYATIANRPKSKGGWCVNLLHRDTAQVIRHPKKYGAAKRRVDQIRTISSRPVWCPVVANTYFVVRRHGDIYITGNTPIQGGIADVMNIRLTALQGTLRRESPRTNLVLQIHDAAIFDVPRGDADLVESHIVQTWKEPVRLQPSVVCREAREFLLPAEIKRGRRWSDFG